MIADTPEARMQQIAADKHLGFEYRAIRYIMSRMPRNAEEPDEIKSLVREFAIEAVYKYQPGRGSFPSFLYRWVWWEATKWLRSRDHTTRAMGGDDRDESEFGAHGNGRAEEQARVREFLSELSQPSQEIFRDLVSNADGYAMNAKTLGWRKVQQLTGRSELRCRAFVNEVRGKGVKYV